MEDVLWVSLTGGMFNESTLTVSTEADMVRVDSSISI